MVVLGNWLRSLHNCMLEYFSTHTEHIQLISLIQRKGQITNSLKNVHVCSLIYTNFII